MIKRLTTAAFALGLACISAVPAHAQELTDASVVKTRVETTGVGSLAFGPFNVNAARDYQAAGSLGSLSQGSGAAPPNTVPAVTVTPTVTAGPVTVTPTATAVPVTVTPTVTNVPVTVVPTSTAVPITTTPTVTAPASTVTPTADATITSTITASETTTTTVTATATPVTVTPTKTAVPVTSTPTVTAPASTVTPTVEETVTSTAVATVTESETTTVTSTKTAAPVTVTPTVSAVPVTTTPRVTAPAVTVTPTEIAPTETITPTLTAAPVTTTPLEIAPTVTVTNTVTAAPVTVTPTETAPAETTTPTKTAAPVTVTSTVTRTIVATTPVIAPDDSSREDASLSPLLYGKGLEGDPFTVEDRNIEQGEPVEYYFVLSGQTTGDGLKEVNIRVDLDSTQAYDNIWLANWNTACPESAVKAATDSYIEFAFRCRANDSAAFRFDAVSSAASGEVVPVKITVDGVDQKGNPLKVLNVPLSIDSVRVDNSYEDVYTPMVRFIQYTVH